jgi:hypothetical protein
VTNYEEYCKTHPAIPLEKYIDMRFDAVDKAVAIYRDEMNRRLEGMNEIRSQLDRQAAGFITREAVEGMIELQTSRILAMERAGMGAAITVVVGIVIGVVVWILKTMG